MRRLMIGLVVFLAFVTYGATASHAQPAPPGDTVCILFEDDSFMCGTAAQDAGYLDLHRPYIIGCIPDGLCDSLDGVRGEAIDGAYEDNLYSEAVCPDGCQHGSYAPK